MNAQELQASVDASLTFGLLWLEHLREHCGKAVVESLALFVPVGTSGVVRARMAHLARGVCKWRLFEVDERGDELQEKDCNDGATSKPAWCTAPTEAARANGSNGPLNVCDIACAGGGNCHRHPG